MFEQAARHFPARRRLAALPALFLFIALCLPGPTPSLAQPLPADAAVRLALSIETKDQPQRTSETKDRRDDASGMVTGTLPAPRMELRTGGIRARLKATGAGERFPAGTPAFAEITLTNETGKSIAGAELVLSTEVAEIVHVSGSKIEADAVNGQQVATLKRLRKGRPKKLTVELRLRAGEDRQEDATDNRLTITLRRPGDEDGGASTIISWPVTDCAGAFYDQLTAIREANAERIGPALKAAWNRDRSRAGRWLFRPATTSRRAKRKCVRWRKDWDPWRARYRTRCTRYRTIAPRTPKSKVKVTKEERQLFRLASGFVRSRAIDPKIGSKQNWGYVSQKVANDLRGYLKQDKHPALCTGAVGFAGYYTERMAKISERAAYLAERRNAAHKAAIARTAEAREAVLADPGGHPGWGAAPLSVLQTPDNRSLQELVADLAVLGDGEAPVSDIRNAEGSYEALKITKGFVSKGGLKPLGTSAEGAIRHALSLIEAADYIGEVARQYAEIDNSITGSLRAIEKAHGRHCGCE